MKPGSVNSADRVPPPICDAASKIVVRYPARVSSIAAVRPLGPDPMTTACFADLLCIIARPRTLEADF
jgi:hypothetical protein